MKKNKRKNIFNDEILVQSYEANSPLHQRLQLKRHFANIRHESPFIIPFNPFNKSIEEFNEGYSEYLALIWDFNNNGILPLWKMERLEALILRFGITEVKPL